MERWIEGETRLQAPPDRARRVLRDHVEVLVGAEPLVAHLRQALGVGPIRHEIVLTVGHAVDHGNRVVRRLMWEAALHPDRFPVFDGEIAVEVDDAGAAVLSLRGVYDVPFGTLGRFGDGLAGRRVARHCVAGFLEDVARRLDIAAEPLAAHEPADRYQVEVLDRGAALAVG